MSDMKAIERFWAKVNKDGPRLPRMDSPCWMWTAHASPLGYGNFWVGRLIKAHRFSWEAANGQIPAGRCVLHRCDNPPCVNPAHLFLGSIADNNADMYAKGRGLKAQGAAHGNAKLTEAQALFIRDSKIRTKELAAMFGLGRTTVQRIRGGYGWKSLESITKALGGGT